MAETLRYGSAGIDLSERYFRDATVDASPADATETIIATLSLPTDVAVTEGIRLSGFAAFTVGTAGVSVNLKIRRTNASGTTLKATGAVTYTAADLGALTVQVLDTGGTLPNQVYVLTMTVASASAASTVSAVEFEALII